MADRHDDYERNRERGWDRDRERPSDAGRRYDEYRRETRGDRFGHEGEREQSYGGGRRQEDWGGSGQRWSGRGEDWGSRESYGTEGGQYESGQPDWRSRDRERSGYSGQSWGGGMGSYSGQGQEWGSQRSSFGGMGQGYGQTSGHQSREMEGQRFGDRSGSYYGQGSGSGFGGQSSSGGQYSTGTYGSTSSGRFVGRGPKGYQRSDARIMEEVCERLEQHPDVDASEVEVHVNNGEVTLTGSVEDRHQKRLAEDAVEHLSGVREVHNQLKVSRGIGQRIGEALGISNRESETTTSGSTVTGTTERTSRR
ncbi:MAG: BON domain-containing protein [Bryobacteraceae bacterium]|nr:BON domain-containing protein [Bryobacteraceae bacterium]